MSGYYKTHRKIFESDLWPDVIAYRLFELIRGKAVFADGVKIGGVEVKRGQYVRSYRQLREDLRYKEGRGFAMYSLSSVKQAALRLVEQNRLSINETVNGTLFTVVNYNAYQGFEDSESNQPHTPPNVNRTLTERIPNNNKKEKEGEERYIYSSEETIVPPEEIVKPSKPKKTGTKYTDQTKAIVRDFKTILEGQGITLFAKDWFITSYAVCQSLLGKKSEEQIRKVMQWAAKTWDCRNTVTHFKHVERAWPHYEKAFPAARQTSSEPKQLTAWKQGKALRWFFSKQVFLPADLQLWNSITQKPDATNPNGFRMPDNQQDTFTHFEIV